MASERDDDHRQVVSRSVSELTVVKASTDLLNTAAIDLGQHASGTAALLNERGSSRVGRRPADPS